MEKLNVDTNTLLNIYNIYWNDNIGYYTPVNSTIPITYDSLALFFIKLMTMYRISFTYDQWGFNIVDPYLTKTFSDGDVMKHRHNSNTDFFARDVVKSMELFLEGKIYDNHRIHLNADRWANISYESSDIGNGAFGFGSVDITNCTFLFYMVISGKMNNNRDFYDSESHGSYYFHKNVPKKYKGNVDVEKWFDGYINLKDAYNKKYIENLNRYKIPCKIYSELD